MTRNNWQARLGLAALLGLWMLPGGVAFDEHEETEGEGGEYSVMLLADDHEETEGEGGEVGAIFADHHEDGEDDEHEDGELWS